LPAQVRNGGALPDAKAFAAFCRQDRKNGANAKSAAISMKNEGGPKMRPDYRQFIADQNAPMSRIPLLP